MADDPKRVNLPRTAFPMRGDLPKSEPKWLEFWEKNQVYRKMLERAQGSPAFVLHDGPPYANGPIHTGHALDKTLKDMTVKSRALMGSRAPYRPGWDCHGLPIEHALLKEMKAGKKDIQDVPAFRRKAVEFAENFIRLQREQFKRLGVLGEWDDPYRTMSREYEARVLRAFRLLLKKGYVYRGLKPVHWCVHCETALAEAEIEYKQKSSPSIYAAFPQASPPHPKLPLDKDIPLEVLVWTTTPWTLPANQAVAFHPELDYVLAEFRRVDWKRPRRLLLARARLDAVRQALGAELARELGAWKGKELIPASSSAGNRAEFLHYDPPFKGSGPGLGVLSSHVSAEEGTGIVHIAPAHGEEDFQVGQRYGLKALCPVDGSGRFLPLAGAGEFAGKHILKEGNAAVVFALKAAGRLLAEGKVEHSYPHCWRCKNPIVFRATEQWFLSLEQDGLRGKLQEAIDSVHWVPSEGKARISSMVENRPDWCLSRQRVWGTPIPILFCALCNREFTDQAFLEAVERRVEREGSDFWFEGWGREVLLGTDPRAPQDAVPWSFPELGPVACPGGCGSRRFRRGSDILDVWLDSGASWLAVLEPRGEYPCDLYLEGSDQHRGWFQSSLVLSVALEGKAPYKTVLTHGFILDEQGRAMHKSAGNAVEPQEIVAKAGADVLRLWVALADYTEDVKLSPKLLEGPSEAYRKVRNTLRYLLGNLCDFDPEKDAPAPQAFSELDRYLLHRLEAVREGVLLAYREFHFRQAARSLVDFCNLDLSSLYLDACKDKLYTFAPGAPERRAAQWGMWRTLRTLLPLLAPVLSFTAEEAWQELRRLLKDELRSTLQLEESVFLAGLPPPDARLPAWTAELGARWEALLQARARALKALEQARAAGTIGGSLQAKVLLRGAAGGRAELLEQRYAALWPELLIVSQVELRPSAGELSVEVSKAPGSKCARCWRVQEDMGADASDPGLCSRCVRQLAAS